MAGLLEGRYQVSFSVNSLRLILNSGPPGHDGGEVWLQWTLAGGALGREVKEGRSPGYP